MTTTTASFEPGEEVSGALSQAILVPFGSDPASAMESSAFGVAPLSTVCVFAAGAYWSAWVRTSTCTLTSSVVPSGYVTRTTPSLVPGVEVSGVVAHSMRVPSGSCWFGSRDSAGSSSVFWSTTCTAGCGSYCSFCAVTVTFTGTLSTLPSG